MKDLHNIDKSAFRKRQYVGYAHGVWYINNVTGSWIARHRDDPTRPLLYGHTLADISKQLDEQGPAPHNKH